ncbi:hypothetical protein HPP92_016032 [Vanilla planifolia]|uniref:Uncharacterized protein n=1 Tax=Vanilla planifolia TaxID=51239 RepID=A0A835UVN7_VANPL|nr:hypothetical protein HPP92_016032 [Vanilla planifolia]
MDKVKVVGFSMVKPASPTPSSTIWLSNLDLFAAWYHVPTIYFFRPAASIATPSATDLKLSLSRVLVPYYAFAGRFTRSPDGRREIKCTAEGAYFAEAVSELSLDEFGVYTPSVENCRLLVPAHGSNPSDKNEESTPILLVQLTTFRCGGVCLAIALSHKAADGISALSFTCAWAAATRKPTQPIPDPSFDHTPLTARSPPTVRFSHPEFDLRPRPTAPKPASFAYLYLKKAQLRALKASIGGEYSSYEAVAGHIWRCICLARGPAQPDEEVRLLMTADVRKRLRPPLTEGYVGNAIIPTVAVAKAADLVEAIPAARIREAIVKLNNDYLRSSLDFLEMQEDKRGLSRSAGNFAATDVSVTSWMQLPIDDVDFGWGRTEYFGMAAFTYARQCCVMKTPNGGVKVGISLETEYMEGFKELFHGLVPAQETVHALANGS